MSNERKERIEKILAAFKKDLLSLRTGRASAGLVENIVVDAYGQKMPLSHTASVAVPEARTILITPWDKSVISAIEKALQAANLGANPTSDGDKIRLSLPSLSEERRKDLVKQAKARGEEARVALRAVRRDDREAIEKEKKAGKMSEDDRERQNDAVQKDTDGAIAQVDKILAEKEKEILEF